MREFEERRRVKRLLHSRYAIAALIIFAVLLIRGVWGAYEKYSRSEDVAERMQAEYESLKSKESSLASSIADLDTEEGKEREIRDRFGAVKEGERLIILVDDAPAARSQAKSEERGFWQRLKAFFTRD